MRAGAISDEEKEGDKSDANVLRGLLIRFAELVHSRIDTSST